MFPILPRKKGSGVLTPLLNRLAPVQALHFGYKERVIQEAVRMNRQRKKSFTNKAIIIDNKDKLD